MIERHHSARFSIRGTHAGYHGEAEEGNDVAAGIRLGSLTGSPLGLIDEPLPEADAESIR